jgi:preprotein translocase subunit SecG
MYVFLLVIHVLAAGLLVVVILIQRGRGGGLVESFSGVQSMFGTKTSLFLTRITAVLAILFLFTSISLAFLAARQSRSLINEKAISSTIQEEAGKDKQPAESEMPTAEPEAPAVQQEPIQEQAVPTD